MQIINKTIGDIRIVNKMLGGGDMVNLGKALHQVQDFYSHSNYVELYIEYYKSNNGGAMPTSVPIYDKGIKDDGFRSLLGNKLRTGEFDLKGNEFYKIPGFERRIGEGSHAQMNKDHANTPAGKLAEGVATKHTKEILDSIR